MRTVFQQPYPGAAPSSKSYKKNRSGFSVQGNMHISQLPQGEGMFPSYHRRLIELAAVGIVLGVIFLMFWQGVLRFSFGPPTWDAQYCQRLLGQYDPAIQTAALAEERAADSFRLTGVFGAGASTVEIAGVNDTVATCSINIVSDQPVGSGYGEPYNCTLATVRYKSETQSEWLMTAIQTELPAEIAAGTARFATFITYYNPAARAAYDTVVEQLNAHACEI